MFFWLLVQVGCVTRLVPQKGVHLIRHAIYRTLERGGQFILLGSSPVSSIQVCHWMNFSFVNGIRIGFYRGMISPFVYTSQMNMARIIRIEHPTLVPGDCVFELDTDYLTFVQLM
jgi:glycosyltransferase involved in cell wall biosynthesis